MRLVLFFVFSLIIHTVSIAQVGNEWISFGQSYFKIPVARDGIYKLTYTELQNAGFPLGSLEPKNLQLYHRGEEVAIHVQGESDNTFDAPDYILFYGQRNDGTLDAELYKPASSQPHALYNLYSDTTSYFLTVGSVSGKRMVSHTELNPGSLLKENFHLNERLLLLTSQHALGQDFGDVHQTIFDQGEGWMGDQITQGAAIVPYVLTNLSQRVITAQVPQLEMVIVGRGAMSHQVEVYAGPRLLTTLNFSGFEAHKFTSPLAWSDIAADESLTIGVRVVGVGGEPDRVSVAYCNVSYAQGYDMGSVNEKIFYIPAHPTMKAYVEIQNPPAQLLLFDVTDPGNVLKIGTTVTATQNAVIPASVPRKILASSVVLTPSIKEVKFRQIFPAQHDYIIITHPLLRKPAGGSSDPVQAYAAYRASDAGGAYDTLLINIDQVYDQFNYGETSPLGVFHFMKFLSSVKAPRYLFLVGKGLEWYYGYHRAPSVYGQFPDLVPSAGYPASDMAYTAGLSGTTYEPAVPTGRITVTKSQQVVDYLNKIKEMEALPYNAMWRKNLLHLSGGIKDGEPQLFKLYMQDFQSIAEGYHLGGKVTPMAKYSTSLQPINISDQVNAGLNTVTFFGHSEPTSLDYEIGYPSHPINGFNNKGKYPLVLINGCDAGAYFLNTSVLGEDWVLTPDKGSIGFIAHSAYGFVAQLKMYSDVFYSVGYGDSTFISKGIGDIQKETARRYMALAPPIASSISQVQQMVLQGDPAYRLFGTTVPDLETNDDNVFMESFDGKPVTALTDSFAIRIIVRNFGQASNSPVKIEVSRTLSDKSTIVYDSLYPMPKYTDTLTFVVRKGREQSSGDNTFRIAIDPDNVVDEITNENNVAELSVELPLNGTKNLFPHAFSIVGDRETELSFQTNSLLSGERDFIVELDTTNTFDSPYKKSFTVKGTVFAKQSITLIPGFDTLAYYWRSKLAVPLTGESAEWSGSTFTFIDDGPQGWAQVHFPQFLYDQTSGIVADSALRKFVFRKTVTSVSVKTYGSAFPLTPDTPISIKIDGYEQNYSIQGFACRTNTINLVAFDRNTGSPYIGLQFEWFENFGRDCGRQPFVINNFTWDQLITGNGDDIVAYIDRVAAGDSVLIFTMGDPGFANWPQAAKNKFAELGVSIADLELYQTGTPLVVFGRKGAPSGSASVHAPSAAPGNQQSLEVSRTITAYSSSGTITSTVIGPAQHWQQFKALFSELESSDLATFGISGIKKSGEEEILFDNINGTADLTSVSAEEFPYLKINFTSTDDVNTTATRLDQWLVLYTPVAEGILLFKGPQQPTVLNEGQTWNGAFGFVNISSETFPDSLTVTFEIFNRTTRKSEIRTFRIDAPVPGDTTMFPIVVNTSGRIGVNDLNINVNPGILPEQYYDNNKLGLSGHLTVEGESLRPVLQVYIDGRQVENGDHVSPNPAIRINLWDGNKYVLKTDTLGINIFLTYPCIDNCVATRVLLSGSDVVVHPATPSSDFQIDFHPTQLPEGEYTLQVEANDAHGNPSGAEPYKISFVVTYERAVILHPPYPNPSNDLVTFVVEITGESLPEELSLQITHTNGQVVADFDEKAFSNLHTGKNFVVWNTSDANGNQLPNGIYIYKQVATLQQERIVQYGKIVVVR